MANDVVVRFLLKGMPEVERALRSVEQAAARAGRAAPAAARPTGMSTAARNQARRDAAALSEETRDRALGQTRNPRRRQRGAFEGPPEPTRAQVRAQQRSSFEGPPEPTAAQRKKGDDAEAKAELRETLKRDAEIRRIKARMQTLKDRDARADMQRQKATANAAEFDRRRALKNQDTANREMVRSNRWREQENNQILREGRRLEERMHRDQTNEIKRKDRKRERDEERDKNKRDEMGRGFGRGVADTALRAGSRVAGVAGNVVSMATQLAGGFTVTDSVMKEQAARKKAAELSASSDMTGKVGDAVSTEKVLSSAKAVGISQNVDTEKVLQGYDEIKKSTGDLKLAIDAMPEISKIATATGTDLGDMSKLAGQIVGATPTISKKDLVAQMQVLTKQGIVGGVEISDLAKYGSRLTAGASQFGGGAAKNTSTMGALAQMGKQYGGATSAAEAALGSTRFSTDIASHASKLKEKGIDVSDGKGTLKDAQSVILEMLEKTGGDVTKLADLGLGKQGVKPLAGAAALYRNAGGGEAGKEAVKAEFKKYTSGVSDEEIDAAAKKILAEQQMEVEMKKLSMEVGQTLLPILRDLAPTLREVAPVFSNVLKQVVPPFTKLIESVGAFASANQGLINSLAEHPIGVLIGAEIAKAGLPSLLSSTLGPPMSQLAGMSLGAAGPIASLGAAAVVAAAAMYMAKKGIDEAFGKESKTQDTAIGHQMEAAQLAAKMKRGDALTPEETAKAEKLMSSMKEDVKQQVDLRENPGIWKSASAVAANIVGGGGTDIVDASGKVVGKSGSAATEAANAEEHNRQETIRGLNDSMKLLAAAMNKVAAKQDTGGSGGGEVPKLPPPPVAAHTGAAQRK